MDFQGIFGFLPPTWTSPGGGDRGPRRPAGPPTELAGRRRKPVAAPFPFRGVPPSRSPPGRERMDPCDTGLRGTGQRAVVSQPGAPGPLAPGGGRRGKAEALPRSATLVARGPPRRWGTAGMGGCERTTAARKGPRPSMQDPRDAGAAHMGGAVVAAILHAHPTRRGVKSTHTSRGGGKVGSGERERGGGEGVMVGCRPAARGADRRRPPRAVRQPNRARGWRDPRPLLQRGAPRCAGGAAPVQRAPCDSAPVSDIA